MNGGSGQGALGPVAVRSGAACQRKKLWRIFSNKRCDMRTTFVPPEAGEKDPELDDLDDLVRLAAAFRTASRVRGLPKDEAARLVKLDEATCLLALSDPIATLRWMVDRLGRSIPPGHADLEYKFFIRSALSALDRQAQKSPPA